MLVPRFTTMVLAGVLAVGGGTAVLAQTGVLLPDEADERAVEATQDVVLPEQARRLVLDTQADTPDVPPVLDEDTDTETAPGGDKNADFVAFVEHVKANYEGCERGLRIAAVASSGPAGERDFSAEPDPDKLARCKAEEAGDVDDEGTGTAAVTDAREDGQSNRPADADEAGGRARADEARGDHGDAGDAGRQTADDNRPDHASEEAGRARAEEHRPDDAGPQRGQEGADRAAAARGNAGADDEE